MNAITAVSPIAPVDHIRRQSHRVPPTNTKNYRVVYHSRKKSDLDFYSASELTVERDAARQHGLTDLKDPVQVARCDIKCIKRISDGQVVWTPAHH
jgi:hypothetical protein